MVKLSVVSCEGKKGLGRERAAKDQRMSLAEDTLRIVPVNMMDILAEWEHGESMAELEELGSSPTFGQEGVAFGSAVAGKAHGAGHY